MVAEISSSVPRVLPGPPLTIAGAGPSIVHILVAVADVFSSIPWAAVVPGVPAFLSAVANVFPAAAVVLMAVSDVLDPVVRTLMAILGSLVGPVVHPLLHLRRDILRQLVEPVVDPIVGAVKPLVERFMALLKRLTPVGMVLQEPLSRFRVVLLELLELLLPPFIPARHHFFVALRVGLF